MKVEHLISCVSKDPRELAKQMNLQTDAVIISRNAASAPGQSKTTGRDVINVINRARFLLTSETRLKAGFFFSSAADLL